MAGQEPDWTEVEALFDEAQELPETRQADFVRARAGESALAEEVLSLLAAARHSTQFLESPGTGDEALDGHGPGPGERLGAWRIDSLIGRGGMGLVYKVVRADGQYEQDAALKLMKPVSPAHRQMFDRERQYLARLEHPGIARLLDGGLTPDGRAWMVMELASGAPADKWVREHRPGIRTVIRLVMEAGEALAYAHGKLIVHRDVKPSNILVDDTGRTRVIDFGVAHIEDDISGGGLPLSLDYAAPELLDGRPAGTASDIYGLAATLYTLLAGRPPCDLSADPVPLAVSRAAREVPQPVSHHMTGRRSTPLLRDLDAILAKALSKSPEARYATVEMFCEDLARALDGRPVEARQSERGYTAARFFRRHAWQSAAAAALAVSLAGGMSVSLWQARKANIERDWALSEQARLEAVQQYLYFMLRDGADATGGTGASAQAILEAAADQVTEMFANDPEQGGPVMHTLGELYFYLNDYEAALPMLQRVVEAESVDPEVMARARYDLAQVRLRTGNHEAAGPLLAAAQDFWEGEPDRWRRRLIDSRLVEARLLRDQGRINEAVALLDESLQARIELSGGADRQTGVHQNDLGVMLITAGRREEARKPLRAALETWERTGLENSPDALNTLNNLATIEALAGRYAEAAPLFHDILDIRRTMYGPSAATAAVLNNYGKTLLRLDRPDEALPLLEEGVEMARVHAGISSIAYASAVAGLAEALSATGQAGRALQIAREGHDQVTGAAGETHPAAATTAIALARETAAGGNSGEARLLLDQAEAIFRPLGAAAGPQLELIERLRTRFDL